MITEIQKRSVRAFTLIEVLIAITIFAILLAAIDGLFYGAMHLQIKTTDAIEEGLPAEHAATIIKRDIQGMVLPNPIFQTNTSIGITPGGIQQTSEGSNYIAGLSTSGASSGMQQTPPLGIKGMIALELYTSSGVISDDLPWGDVQKVDYSLEMPADRLSPGKDLVRSVTRNLLAPTAETPEQQRLLSNVQQLQVSFFDGTNWMDIWGATSDTNYTAPTAIRFLVNIAPDPQKKGSTAPLQYEWLFPVPVGQIATNSSLISTN